MPIPKAEFITGEEGALIVDQIRDPKESDYADRIALKQGVLNLPVREKEVILARYYMGKTQMEIAKEFDMSQAQVSRLEKSAIKKLKTAL
ncbi:MAG: sigma-70 family RNA polymerase sigma factor [Bacteroidaceae bacterium]|nr:sigma-70 family RNA polymerase sigma factor [Bacteroidaceae bacterium]